MKLTRRDLRLAAIRQTLFVDDPLRWPMWRHVAWLLPLVVGIVTLLMVLWEKTMTVLEAIGIIIIAAIFCLGLYVLVMLLGMAVDWLFRWWGNR